MPVAPLPDLDTLDSAALKDMVIKQHAQISSHDAEVERLRLIIARLRRLQFGRKSEKIQREIEQAATGRTGKQPGGEAETNRKGACSCGRSRLCGCDTQAEATSLAGSSST